MFPRPHTTPIVPADGLLTTKPNGLAIPVSVFSFSVALTVVVVSTVFFCTIIDDVLSLKSEPIQAVSDVILLDSPWKLSS